MVLSKQADDFFNRPLVIRDPNFHRGRYAARLMHSAEVVMHEVNCPRGSPAF
jgi:hypothetical protein